MESYVVCLLLVNLMTIVFLRANEGSYAFGRTKISKMNQGELEQKRENLENYYTDREGQIDIREDAGGEEGLREDVDYLTATSATDGDDPISNRVTCQFEDSYICGYRKPGSGASLNHTSENLFGNPQYDHTYGNNTGHFLVVFNYTDMLQYYANISDLVNFMPNRLGYLSAIIMSPSEDFTTESCVYFYYCLNGTAVRPNPLSAQLYVYVNDSSGRRLAWYDNVNRTVNGWLKGWASLKPGINNIIFKAKTVTTTTVWPGLVALDDVSVISGPCPVLPDCGPDTFRCRTTSVCLPIDMQCDGGNDCADWSDEENCISKANYQVRLINGDGSYGSVAIFYQGRWRPVCMDKDSMMGGNGIFVNLVCQTLGFTEIYQGAFVNSWHQPVQYAMEVSCSDIDVDISGCNMTITETNENTDSCYYYQAALCSSDDCFSGERVCPPDHTNANNHANTKCISIWYFCDGIADCPGGTDEVNCGNCSLSEFECTNHECVPASQRCDGTPQCGDKTDEYGCVIVARNVPRIYHSQLSDYLPVCYNNMTKILADMLCSLSGKGTSNHYESYTYGQGTVLTPQSNTATSIVPGYAVSTGSCNSTLIKCASYACGTTIFDDGRLSKILHGRYAVLGQLPWQIALYENGRFKCGGVIIHPNWVLTAAHCIDNSSEYSVIAGSTKPGTRIPDVSQDDLYLASRNYIHPLYQIYESNDTSLLYLIQPIAFNDNVRPICIASKTTVEEILNAGYNAECYISGYGVYHNFINTDLLFGHLQFVRVHIVNEDVCHKKYEFVPGTSPDIISVCVDNQNFGAPTCFGDSGGPLICRNKNGRFEVLGTLSIGSKSCFVDGYPSIYDLLYPYASWVEQITCLNFSDLTMDND